MSRRRRFKGRDVHGILRLDQPTGLNSHGRPDETLASKRTRILVSPTAPGARSARWVVPPMPVTWQISLYSGTAA